MYSRNASNNYESGNTAHKVDAGIRTKRPGNHDSSRRDRRPVIRQDLAPRRYYDYGLLFAVVLLFAFGLLAIYSGSQYNAMMSASSLNDGTHFFFKQLKIGGISLALAIVLSLFGCKWIKCLRGLPVYVAYFSTVGMLIFTLVKGIASHGKSRWIQIGNFFQIQPAELAKVAVILVVAYAISESSKKYKKRQLLRHIAVAIAIPTILILKQNISSAFIVAFIGIAMLFVALRNIKGLAILGGTGFAGFLAAKPLIRTIITKAGLTKRPEQYYLRRIVGWACPELFPTDAYQTMQGLYAIGSGGLTGHGLGESIQKFGKIPEVQNDMIFSIICEELGFVGAAALFIVFIIVLYRILLIAMNTDDLFGSLICTGVMAHIGIQVVLNIAVVTGVMPNTGVTLPFISYGGTAILCTMIEIGLVLGVASRIKTQ